MLAAGVPVTIPVTITNNGPRQRRSSSMRGSNSTTSITLANIDPPASSAGYALPLTGSGPEWLVPTQTSSVKAAASGDAADRVRLRPEPG